MEPRYLITPEPTETERKVILAALARAGAVAPRPPRPKGTER